MKIEEVFTSPHGNWLEKIINVTNSYYLDQKLCVCYKKPTPICVLKSKGGQISNAFFEHKSTTDYYGLVDGKMFDFDAKMVKGSEFNVKKTVKVHQLSHLKTVEEFGGLSFIIVYFSDNDLYYLIPFSYLIEHKTIRLANLPLEWKIAFNPIGIVDYLPTLKEVYALR